MTGLGLKSIGCVQIPVLRGLKDPNLLCNFIQSSKLRLGNCCVVRFWAGPCPEVRHRLVLQRGATSMETRDFRRKLKGNVHAGTSGMALEIQTGFSFLLYFEANLVRPGFTCPCRLEEGDGEGGRNP